MFRERVPLAIRPWVYVFFAFCFQMSGGLYLGSLHEIISGRQMLLEDVLMCLYCNLAGMTVYFPLLFRFKFHFPNKVLLVSAATGILLCQFLAPLAPNLPSLWALCVVSGFCKIQGTFECLSNIQLWITPKRDFRVFFPVLHIFILGAMQVSDFVAAWFTHVLAWEYMHLFMTGLFLIVLVMLLTLTRRIRLIPDVPLVGIDWSGAVLWLALLIQVSGLFCYARTLDWFHSPVIQTLALTSLMTLIAIFIHNKLTEKPYISTVVFRNVRVLLVFVAVAVLEALLATEHVLEEIFYEECMEYGKIQTATNDIWSFIGVVAGCLLSILWMKTLNLNPFRLTTLALGLLTVYVLLFYTNIAADFDFRTLRTLILFRTMAYAMIGASLMFILEQLCSFEIFFMALSVFNMFHMLIGGVVGAAIYSYGIDYYMADNFSRYAAYFDHISLSRSHLPFEAVMGEASRTMMFVSIKQILGWIAYACIGSLLIMLLYKVPAVRSSYKRMRTWTAVARGVIKREKRRKASAAQ